MASDELTATVQAARVPGARYVLPADLDRCGLLAWLSPAQFADALTEAIHVGGPGGARTERALDVRVLEQLTAALDGRISPARLAAATRCALGHPVPPGLLTSREQALICERLFPTGYQQQISTNLARLDAFLSDLARSTGYAPTMSPPPAPAYYTCLALEAGARSARGEVLTALAVQWLTVLVSANSACAPAVITTGTDEIARPHLERLSDACERRKVPLTFLFRHLREDALQLLGGGTTAFMRLGNHTEAEQAGGYLGRHHKFVLSQLTATYGGNETQTRSDTYGYGDSDNSSRNWQEFHLGPGTRSRGNSASRNWSVGVSGAEGTSWSDAASVQRVYEYAVEPAVLQNLPEHALLLAVPGSGGPEFRAVECDPVIATMPGVDTRPPAPLPVPLQTHIPQLPPATRPSWPTSSGPEPWPASLPWNPVSGRRRHDRPRHNA
jgi:hypothetical protein